VTWPGGEGRPASSLRLISNRAFNHDPKPQLARIPASIESRFNRTKSNSSVNPGFSGWE